MGKWCPGKKSICIWKIRDEKDNLLIPIARRSHMYGRVSDRDNGVSSVVKGQRSKNFAKVFSQELQCVSQG